MEQEKLISKEEFMTLLRDAESPEDIIALAKENGVDLSADAAQKMFDEARTTGELSDEQLEGVTGGCFLCKIGSWFEKAAEDVKDFFVEDIPQAAKEIGVIATQIIDNVKCPGCGSISTVKGVYMDPVAGHQCNYRCKSCGKLFLH